MIAVLAVTSLAANAGTLISTGFTKTNTVSVGGTTYKVWAMQVTTDDNWLSSYMDIDLTSGSLYQNIVWGGLYDPNPVIFMMIDPDLEWDTYVADPDRYPTLPGTAGTPVCTTADFDVSWFNYQDDDGPGTHFIAQITLSADSNGNIIGESYDPDYDVLGASHFEYYIINGEIVPEPATLSLITIGAIGVLLRRKRKEHYR